MATEQQGGSDNISKALEARIGDAGFDGDAVGPKGRMWPCPLFLPVHLLESKMKGGLP